MDVNLILQQLKERLETDAGLRVELERDPEAVLLRETGMTAEELGLHAGRIGDDALENVAGGTGYWEEPIQCPFCDYVASGSTDMMLHAIWHRINA